LKELIDKFVCVRLVKANDLDLTLFQFDYDLTFAVFFMNADKTLYGRYGTRSSLDDATKDISMAGLADAMSAALLLHEQYPGNRELLAGKQAVATKFKTPDDFPSLRGKFKETLDYEGAVTKSCLHCHQVGDAERQIYRSAGKPIPDRLLFPHPAPSVVGLTLDPRRRAAITAVREGSAAASSGFQPGDEILALDGQTILSLADIQWVLHNAPASGQLDATVQRDGARLRLTLTLDDGWRRRSDISWRVSSWPLRRMGTGGLLFAAASAEQRRKAGVANTGLALVVKHVGQYGAHAAAKRAGFRQGDVVVSFDGQNADMSRSQLLAYAAQKTQPGQQVPVIVVREGQRLELQLPMQE
jgi:predicted metalloprotease with PDZ domain